MRREDRTEVSVPIQLMWADRQGTERFAFGQSLDICRSGMRIQAPYAIAERSYVRFRADGIRLEGSASVRSCQKKGTKYVIGLEFSGGLTWRPSRTKPETEEAQAPTPVEPVS